MTVKQRNAAAGRDDRGRGRPGAQGQLRAGRDAHAWPRRRRRRCSTSTQRFIRALESAAKLDRELEALPDDEELAEREREHKGLTRPELSVLLAYSKIDLYARAARLRRARGPLPVRRARSTTSRRSCPSASARRCARTGCAREIVATQVVNNMLHGGGTTFAFRLHEETGAPGLGRSRAPTRSRARCSGCARSGRRSRRSTTRSSPTCSSRCCSRAGALIERGSRWLLRNRRAPMDIASTVEHFLPGAEILYRLRDASCSTPTTSSRWHARVDELRAAGVPDDLAARVASLSTDVRDVRHRRGRRGQRPPGRGGGRRPLPPRPAARTCTGCAIASSRCRARTAGRRWPAPR